jgi:hypothetical protein
MGVKNAVRNATKRVVKTLSGEPQSPADTKAEEKVLYDAVIAVRDKEAQIDGYEGYIEHDLASKTLQNLAAIASATSPEHKAAAKVLKELVEHHIKEEESNVWDVRRRISPMMNVNR